MNKRGSASATRSGSIGAGDQVVAPLGNDVPHTAGRVFHVAAVSRDDVEMKMKHGLSRCFIDIDTDVETVRLVPGEDLFSCHVDGGDKLGFFLIRGVEPGGDVAFGNEKGVAGIDGKGVP